MKPGRKRDERASTAGERRARRGGSTALAAAFQVCTRDGEGKLVREDAVFFSGVEKLVEAELAARDSAGDYGALAAAVVEECGGLVRQILRLLVHIHAAACQPERERGHAEDTHRARHCAARHRAVCVAGLEIRLQSQTLRVDSGLPETFWFSPDRNFCRALLRPGKSDRSTRVRSARR